MDVYASDVGEPFLGSVALASGEITQRQLRGGGFRRLFRDVYVLDSEPDSHQLRCRAAALIAPPTAMITGRSAATLYGVPLAQSTDPVQVVIPEPARFHHRTGLDVQRRAVIAHERRPWHGISLASPLRTVEYEGAHHADTRQLETDRARLNRLRRAGWRVVFVTADRLRTHNEDIVAEVRAALATRDQGPRLASRSATQERAMPPATP